MSRGRETVSSFLKGVSAAVKVGASVMDGMAAPHAARTQSLMESWQMDSCASLHCTPPPAEGSSCSQCRREESFSEWPSLLPLEGPSRRSTQCQIQQCWSSCYRWGVGNALSAVLVERGGGSDEEAGLLQRRIMETEFGPLSCP